MPRNTRFFPWIVGICDPANAKLDHVRGDFGGARNRLQAEQQNTCYQVYTGELGSVVGSVTNRVLPPHDPLLCTPALALKKVSALDLCGNQVPRRGSTIWAGGGGRDAGEWKPYAFGRGDVSRRAGSKEQSTPPKFTFRAPDSTLGAVTDATVATPKEATASSIAAMATVCSMADAGDRGVRGKRFKPARLRKDFIPIRAGTDLPAAAVEKKSGSNSRRERECWRAEAVHFRAGDCVETSRTNRILLTTQICSSRAFRSCTRRNSTYSEGDNGLFCRGDGDGILHVGSCKMAGAGLEDLCLQVVYLSGL